MFCLTTVIAWGCSWLHRHGLISVAKIVRLIFDFDNSTAHTTTSSKTHGGQSHEVTLIHDRTPPREDSNFTDNEKLFKEFRESTAANPESKAPDLEPKAPDPVLKPVTKPKLKAMFKAKSYSL